MHVGLCLCASIPTIEVATRLVLVAHHREVDKPTATGPLALLALPNAELHVHGTKDAAIDLRHLHEVGRRVLVLFPADDARELSPALLAEDPRPVTLVVPEGSWRQAARLARRVPGLDTAETVVLPPGPPSRYRLRREPRADGLATLEAIARAYGVLEGPAVRRSLEALLDRAVEAVLETRQPSGAPPGDA